MTAEVVATTRARVVAVAVSRARLRRKLAKVHTLQTGDQVYTESGKGAARSARHDRLFNRRFGFWAERCLLSEQAPVKYNRCKLCGYRRHCSPDLVDMRIRLGERGRTL